MSLILVFLGAALAGGLHAGVPVTGVPGLGEPSFHGPAAGWSAGVPGGLVRVFVGHDEAEASAWLNGSVPISAEAPPAYAFADEAWGDGVGLLAFRDGNVSVFVRVSSGALALAERLQASIVDDGSPWPAAPALTGQEGAWTLPVAQGQHVTFQGGRLARGAGWTFTALPYELVVWDHTGRPAQVR